MAWLKKVPRKREGFVYYIVYKVKGKKFKKSTGTDDEKLANIILKKFEAELTLEKHGIKVVDESGFKKEDYSKIRLKDFIGEYPKVRKDKKENTRLIDLYSLNNFYDYTGNVFLDEINRATVTKYKSYRIEHVSPGTVDLEMRSLRAAFYYALDAGYIGKNPFSKYGKLKTKENDLPEFLEIEEIEMMRKAIEKNEDINFRDFFEIALNSGGRRGEILSLEYNDINFKERFLMLKHTKTGRARTVPMSETLEKILKNLCNESKEGKLFDYHEDTPTKKFKKYLKISGVKKDLHLHNLRDTFASHLIMNGVDLLTVSKYMGNSVKIIEKHYGHLSSGYYYDSIKKLPF